MKKAYEILVEQESIKMPHDVYCAFQGESKEITFFGDQLCFGEDYMSLRQARVVIGWFVDQLGGTVKWRKKK